MALPGTQARDIQTADFHIQFEDRWSNTHAHGFATK
jgi:hypothetical protein